MECGCPGVVGKGLSHGEEVVRPEWDGEEAQSWHLAFRALPATCSSGLASDPRKMNPSCPGSDQEGHGRKGSLMATV